jgi:hypothetical protein
VILHDNESGSSQQTQQVLAKLLALLEAVSAPVSGTVNFCLLFDINVW